MEMPVEDRRSLISIRVQMLITLFNKRISDEALSSVVRVFCDGLEHLPSEAITRGFSKAEQELDRFPTPRLMKDICSEFIPTNMWCYDFKPAISRDPETGEQVSILLDPDPNCARCREPRSKHPVVRVSGGKVLFTCRHYKESGRGNDEEMFRPQDCPEGRAFLKTLKEIHDSARKP